jgi:sensor histidine kinase YesM
VETADSTMLLASLSNAQLRIGPSDNFFTVTWGAISFEETPRIRFAYMLEGFDDDWIAAGDRKFARYAKLPGGSYTFKLKAMNDRGEWSEELGMLNVQVSPPFVKTIAFYVLVGAAILAILLAIYTIRVRRIKRESQLKAKFERELAQVEMHALRAQMNPHFLFNSLNSVNRFIVKNDPKSASKYLTRFSRLIRLILDNSKSNKVTLANELEAIKLYVELESLRFDDKFTFEMSVDENVEPDNIEIDSMILQPYIENAIWHGLMHKDGHGKLKLSISRNHASLTCIVEDDGVGRTKAAELKSKSAVKDKSYGMKITSDRLRMLNSESQTNASVEVTDLAQGTRVRITLPC